MDIPWTDYLRLLIAVLAIVNPMGAVPIFLTATFRDSEQTRRRLSRVAGITVGLTLLTAAWCGQWALALFGISVDAFRVGGGILILLMAISMMEAKVPSSKSTPDERREALENENIGVVPLGIPLMSGPGSIALMIVSAKGKNLWPDMVALSAIAIVVAIVSWLTLRVASVIGNRLGKTGINIGTRLMGLVLAATGVEFIAGGLRQLFPVLNLTN